LEDNKEKNTILSIPEVSTNGNILLQLQICETTNNDIAYKILNAFTQEELSTETLRKTERFYTKNISNNLMETELKFIGEENDIIFLKYVGLLNYQIHLQNYKATFDESQNTVFFEKPL